MLWKRESQTHMQGLKFKRDGAEVFATGTIVAATESQRKRPERARAAVEEAAGGGGGGRRRRRQARAVVGRMEKRTPPPFCDSFEQDHGSVFFEYRRHIDG